MRRAGCQAFIMTTSAIIPALLREYHGCPFGVDMGIGDEITEPIGQLRGQQLMRIVLAMLHKRLLR